MSRRVIGAFAIVAVAGVIAVGVVRDRSGIPSPPITRGPNDARAPTGVRIRVEVLNASTVRGLARRATMHLRDRGFDVVESGSSVERHDRTLVLDRTLHPGWANLAARAMGGAAVEARPDTLRDVDLTVMVGAAWRPPPEPFYP